MEQELLDADYVAQSAAGSSRRALLAALGVGAVAAAARSAVAQSTKTDGLTDSQIRLRMLRRTHYGPTEQEVHRAQQMGYDAYLEYQLDWENIDDSACEHQIEWYSTVFWSVRDLFKAQDYVVAHELASATMLRAILSKRQLYQRMVEFWTDHFNVTFDKAGVLKAVHDREVIRANALGNFKAMLMANTKSPANLLYLDNTSSTKYAPNQNLGREIMELHSVGVDGGYTQDDVIAMSKCLTGWTTVLWPYDAENIGQFVFDKSIHYNGPKTFLGKDFPAGQGIKDGEIAVQMLGNKKSTGRHLAQKLCMFFLGHPASPELEEEIATTYVSKAGDIKSMLRIVLRSDNVAASPLMFKRPFHYFTGLLRHSRADISDTWSMEDVLSSMGQHPFSWAPPNGYPFAPAYWVANLLPRWNTPFELFNQEIYGLQVSRATLLGTANKLDTVLARIDKVLLQGEMSKSNKDLVRNELGTNSTAYGKSLNAFAIAAALPGYQKC